MKTIVAVGSENKTKLEPVEKVFSHYFKDIKIVSKKVSSGVSEQPLSEKETYTGALNRAKAVLSLFPEADFGVGIEGGIHTHSFGTVEKTMVIIVDKKGTIGIGISSGLVLPTKIEQKIKQGRNLEQATDELFGTKEIGETLGLFGVFTKEFVTRSSGVEHAVAFALGRFLNKDLY